MSLKPALFAITASMVLGIAPPASAAPLAAQPAIALAPIILAQGESDGYENWLRNNARPDSGFVQGRRAWREGTLYRKYGPVYRGYRGYSEYRPGYRRYNGWWYPPAAFIAGAIILDAPRRDHVVTLSAEHVDWCYDRYRSYRVSDNSWKPRNGPRRECISPFY